MRKGVLSLEYFIKALTLFLAYFVSSEVAFLLYEPPAIFPINAAVALTAVFLGGFRLVPVVLIVGLLNYMMHGVSPRLAISLSARIFSATSVSTLFSGGCAISFLWALSRCPSALSSRPSLS
jgi:hypothetical protein